MATSITPLQERFSLGMKRDYSRDQLPDGAVWDLVDYIPDLEAPLRKRGGFEYASPDLDATDSNADYIRALTWAPFSAGGELLAIADDGDLWEVDSSASATNKGAAWVPRQGMTFYREKVYIPQGDDASANRIRVWDDSTIATITGLAAGENYSLVTTFKDRLVVARNPSVGGGLQEIAYSVAGDPDTWDTTNRISNSTHPIQGMTSVNGMILLFEEGLLERIRGDIPPGVINSDFVLEQISDIGLRDWQAESIAHWENKVVWANANGIYMTDGVEVVDLTKLASMQTWWRDQLRSYSHPSWRVAGGVFGDYYFVHAYESVDGTPGSSSNVNLVMDLRKRVCFRLSEEFVPSCFAKVSIGSKAQETYWGSRDHARVLTISDMFDPGSSNADDPQGNATVIPYVETAFYRFKTGRKNFKALYTTYDLRESSNNPVITPQYITSPEDTSYTSLTQTLAETTALARERTELNFEAEGVAFKFLQSAISNDTRLYGYELEAHLRETSRTA